MSKSPRPESSLDGFDAPLFAWVVHMADGIDSNGHITPENSMDAKFFTTTKSLGRQFSLERTATMHLASNQSHALVKHSNCSFC